MIYFFKELFFKYHYYFFRKSRKKNIYFSLDKKKIRKLYSSNISLKKRIILATQVGRGGGKWLVDILNHCDSVSAFGERHNNEEAIFRYNCSYNKNFRFDKILHLIKTEALSDWELNDISYISSPYFSHGLKVLDKNLRPEAYVIIIRDFYGLLYSLLNKGWYKEEFHLTKNIFNKKTPSIFLGQKSHFYGRYINFKSDNKKFLKSSRPVKVAIFMHQTIKKIYEDILVLRNKKIEIFNLNYADQNYKYCQSFLNKLDIQLNIDEKKFLKLKKRTSSSIENKKVEINKKDLIEIKKIKNKYDYYLNKIKHFV